MYNAALTHSIKLQVPCQRIYIMRLTKNGLLPIQHEIFPPLDDKPQLYDCKNLPPQNLTEQTLLSIWINTHQAMFMAIGMAAHCVSKIIELVAQNADLAEIKKFIQLAVDCRLSSAAYTSLPFLTRELYEAYIRESMKTVHPGFSGVSNQEAIAMETSLRQLKAAAGDLAQVNKQLAVALRPELERLYDADTEWWKYHGKAMGKYVLNPVSLARMDFKDQKAKGSGDKNFEAYRDRILRRDSALADYDQYFAVERSDTLTLQHYCRTLTATLERSWPYIEHTGILQEYRVRGVAALYEVIDAQILFQSYLESESKHYTSS